ncbi:HTH-type transcriptional repressor ComR [Rosistilla oblonga]|uniref:HTH-type transcriptional repressor ComR n=1 Tax=Rosistilla ulvae TaxID=1930277 RepID=A0A517LZ20_9BACT|nr:MULTISPECIES: TetR/AcrR family transcriptional regulator [Rosistilla]QDS87875.1 HTH-type transcriptional repressor ComR [Rosistilla ulvae]QDV12906.1 HTH-type transcriptional repressor ComR [Rosistilla oblonga]
MPWEKSFDEAEVLDKAMHVFWEKGYASTSITDLTTATGIQRGSLYNAFSGKQELFVRSLLKYDTEQRRTLIQKLERMDDPLKAFKFLFDAIVKQSLSDPKKKGCFLINTSLTLGDHDAAAQKIVGTSLREFTEFFEQQIKLGQQRKQIPKSVDPEPTARTLFALLVGMRVMARGSFDKPALQQVADQAMRLVA